MAQFELVKHKERVSAQATAILPTLAGTYELNSFGHVIYAPQTNSYYQNIAKLLTHSRKLMKFTDIRAEKFKLIRLKKYMNLTIYDKRLENSVHCTLIYLYFSSSFFSFGVHGYMCPVFLSNTNNFQIDIFDP